VEESVVEKDDSVPVSIRSVARTGMTGDDCGLQRVVSCSATELLCAMKRGHSSLDLNVVPQRPVLLKQEDGFAIFPFAGRGARRLQFHQREETVYLRFTGEKLHEDSPEPQRVVAKFFPHPLVSRGCGVAFVEDEVDDGENGLKAAAQILCPREFEGNMGFREGLFGAKDSLAEGLLGYEEGAGDFSGGEAAN